MTIRLASNLQPDSVVDGEGIRTVIWTQGCAHACPGCHNLATHDFNGGFCVDIEDVKKEIESLEGQRGITFSGGDPLYQLDEVLELVEFINNKTSYDIWVYTGFTYEEVLKMPKGIKLLKNIDVLVDGMFDINKKTLDAPFRGSANQRIIDTKASIKAGNIILVNKFMQKRSNNNLYQKDEFIYI